MYSPENERAKIQLGISRVKNALNKLDNPCIDIPAIQVVGTNGKGSITAFIENILCAADISVGVTTSPHLIDITERIRFKKNKIKKHELDHYLTKTQNYLTGGASKTWYVAAALPGHLGVGPANTATPDYYSAAPFEKESEGCFYDDVMIFSEQNGNITYVQDNQGATFFNVDFLSVGGGGGDQDQCLGFDTSGEKAVNLSAASSSVPADQTTGTQIIIADGGFMAYYIEPNAYEILEISDDYMYVRAIPGSNSELAWYLKFTTDPAGGGGNSGNDFETEFPDTFKTAVEIRNEIKKGIKKI